MSVYVIRSVIASSPGSVSVMTDKESFVFVSEISNVSYPIKEENQLIFPLVIVITQTYIDLTVQYASEPFRVLAE